MNFCLQPWALAGIGSNSGISGISGIAGMGGVTEMTGVDGVALRNGKNIISNIYFGNDFIATAEDNIENKNHEIISFYS